MYEDDLGPAPLPIRRHTPLISNAVLGTLIFVIIEAMLFAGFVSAFMIVKTQSLGAWPPPGQPRLPVEDTAINTAALLLSGMLLVFANRAFGREPRAAGIPLLACIVLGTFFVGAQGAEWVALLREGLTLTSSNHGSFFYLIVGMHAAHAIAALVVLGYLWVSLVQNRMDEQRFYAGQIFWYFVVGLWPLLYMQVYL